MFMDSAPPQFGIMTQQLDGRLQNLALNTSIHILDYDDPAYGHGGREADEESGSGEDDEHEDQWENDEQEDQ